MRSSRACALWLTSGVVCWCLLSVTVPYFASEHPSRLAQLGYLIAAALLMVAGGTQFVRARISPDSRLAWTAVALTLTGVAILILGGLHLLGAADDVLRPLPLVRPLAMLPALVALGIGALRSPPRIGASATRLIVAGGVAYAAGGVILTVPSVRGTLRHVDGSTALLLVGAATTAAWSLLAVRTLAHPVTPLRNRWCAAFALLAASSLSGMVGRHMHTPVPYSLSVGLLVAAAAVLLATATSGLRGTLAATSKRLLDIDSDLGRARRLLQEAEERAAERRHDARCAALGIEAAVAAADAPVRQTVCAELSRLVSLLDDRPAGPVRPFALGDALAPVLDAQRCAGLAVVSEMTNPTVVGRPAATASALANVLANVGTHAPGATATIRTVAQGDTVALVVDDDGPGIPASERRRVLQRAARGTTATAAGDGLGLFTAARAIAAQGGTLRIAQRPGGGTRVVITMSSAAVALTEVS